MPNLVGPNIELIMLKSQDIRTPCTKIMVDTKLQTSMLGPGRRRMFGTPFMTRGEKALAK